jgi:hypothetical protein
MSDTELLNCYYGIRERVKDIDRTMKKEARLDRAQDHDVISHQTYLVGGQIYGLMQKEKWVMQELNKRTIKP